MKPARNRVIKGDALSTTRPIGILQFRQDPSRYAHLWSEASKYLIFQKSPLLVNDVHSMTYRLVCNEMAKTSSAPYSNGLTLY